MRKDMLMFTKKYMGMLIWDKLLMQHCISNFPEFQNYKVKSGKVEEEFNRVDEPKIVIEEHITIDPDRHIWGDKGKQKRWCLPTLLLDLEKVLGFMPDPYQLKKPVLKKYNQDKYQKVQNLEQVHDVLKTAKTDKEFYQFIHYLSQDQGEFTEEVKTLFSDLTVPVDCPEPEFQYKQPRVQDRQMLTVETPLLAFLEIYKNTGKLVNTKSLKSPKKVDNPIEL